MGSFLLGSGRAGRGILLATFFAFAFSQPANAQNRPPNVPIGPQPFNGQVDAYRSTDLYWQGGDPDWPQPVTYDIYFGTSPSPPMIKSNWPQVGLNAHQFQPPLEFNTQYWWKIVARDADGLESAGALWTFTTSGNHPPVVTWDASRPENGGESFAIAELWWISYDMDNLGWGGTIDAVYLGKSEPLPLVASGITNYQFTSDLLEVGATYYWRIVTSDGELESTGPTWSFTVVSPGNQGDVTNDGIESVDDAKCALQLFTGFYHSTYNEPCGGLGSPARADVNCDSQVTPRDARCIHKHVIDGSCAYCQGNVSTGTAPELTPLVLVDRAWIQYDTLHVQLAVSNVSALEAYGFRFTSDPPMSFVDAVNLGPAGAIDGSGFTHKMGGYFLDPVDATLPVTFIEFMFESESGSLNQVVLTDFVDDLAGAADVTINGNEVPVLISSFRADPAPGGVQVTWELVSDEAMATFTLFRREGTVAHPHAIVKGPVQSNTGWYLDRTALRGKTYHYELLIRTVDGDEFRSPIATATMRGLALALHPNVPNPFNPRTTISYDVPDAGRALRVQLWIVDIAGRTVRTLVDENQIGGSRQVIWNGTNDHDEVVASGVYFYVLDADGARLTRKLVLLK